MKLRRYNYKEYIQSQAWADKKLQFKESNLWRDGRCWVCTNSKIEKHIHHLTYKRLGEERMNDLRILCAVCHAACHHTTSRKMRAKFYPHASREKLWGLRHKDPILYARKVAEFWGVLKHPLCERVFKTAI